MEIRRTFTTVDTHTAGGPTRVLTSGLPFLPGGSVQEKFTYFKNNLDAIRKLLLTEPRGHKDMYGAVVTEPCDQDADLGVFFMTAHGYLATCVHSAMGVAAALLQTGAIVPHPPGTDLAFETPTGLISLEPRYQAGRLASISLQTQPAYVQQVGAHLPVGDRNLTVDLVFSGVFFLLIDVRQNALCLGPEALPELVALGRQALAVANRTVEVRHPDLPAVTGFALALFYEQTGAGTFKDVVIGRTGAVDRSPCGAGSAALAVLLSVREGFPPADEIDIEGVIGTHFQARLVERIDVGGYRGGRPEIRGSAYLTGFHQFVLEAGDPLNEGFIIP